MSLVQELITELADRHGITGEEAEQAVRQELGIKAPGPKRQQRRWTEEEERFLWDHRHDLGFVAEALGRSYLSVKGKWDNYQGVLYHRYGQQPRWRRALS